ncbi:hypothetical protein MMC07_007380 [Pseudocyphellaria aurata]|nr:hypothetical protein [Pseudocyphellaria aurata]
MPDFEDNYQAACQSGLLPGVVLMASSRNDDFHYVKTMGVRTLEPGDSPKPMELDTILRLASCTKLMTAIAALQCVERGLVHLDAEVSPILPETGKFGILTGFDDASGQPVTVSNTKPITVRNLLLHTSGYQYEPLNPLLMKWRASRGEEHSFSHTVETKSTVPLVFEPNTGWAYGQGVDWVGKLIERVTGETLEAYMSKNIWEPLNIKDITFWPKEQEDMKHRMATMSNLDPAGGDKTVHSSEQDITLGTTDCLGGVGTSGSCEAFMTLLRAILKEDSRLLNSQSYEELFKPQLNEQCAAALHSLASDESTRVAFSINIPPLGQKNFSFGGILSMDEYPGWMGKNTALWAGAPGIVWVSLPPIISFKHFGLHVQFIDREVGLCAVAASQVYPPVSPPIMKLHEQFQHGIYKVYASSKKS